MKLTQLILTLLTASSLALSAWSAPVSKDGTSGVALEGYDPIAFFTDRQAAKGNPQISAKFEGATYFFQSEDHKKTFLAAPAKYLPAYGGYCAFGAALGLLLPVDVATWEIVDGRLILQYSQDIKKQFAKDSAANFAKADAFWSKQK